MIRTRTWPDRLARFPMYALRLWFAPARTSPLPAPSVPCIRKGPMQQVEQAFTCVPRAPDPKPQLDPSFPHQRQLPVPGTTAKTPSVQKSLKITVPRAPPRTPLPLNVDDIFDDNVAWSSDPGASTSTSTTSIGVGSRHSVYQERR